MRTLLVQARSPSTYWSYEHSLPFIRKEAALPPLGLVTLAALLPARWELRLVDLHCQPLRDADLEWAEAVLVSGMLVQADSIREVLARARALGRRTVVGGPAVTTSPEAFEEADHLFLGEAEGQLDLLVRTLESPGAAGPRLLSPAKAERPSVRLSPVPRFDLLALDRYASLSVQYSRGCPFQCEFCDIIEIFGRVPRVKEPAQVLAELDALQALGYRGSLFFVDDNFIGNRRETAKLLPELARWQAKNGHPFDFYTEASVDLAAEPALVKAMVEAGFSAVFLGIETPSTRSLAETGKRQNLKRDPAWAVRELSRAGLEVFAGFIIGFDADGEEIFDEQIRFISSLPIPRAMVGLLTALPGTALWRRLEQEGRLRRACTGDQFDRPNFAPALDELALMRGYRRVLASLYSAESYYGRCALALEHRSASDAPIRAGALGALWRALTRIGLWGERRRQFWRLVGRSLRRGPAALARAVTLAVLGEHMIRYTHETVLPRLDRTIAQLVRERQERALPDPRPARARAAELPAAIGLRPTEGLGAGA